MSVTQSDEKLQSVPPCVTREETRDEIHTVSWESFLINTSQVKELTIHPVKRHRPAKGRRPLREAPVGCESQEKEGRGGHTATRATVCPKRSGETTGVLF